MPNTQVFANDLVVHDANFMTTSSPEWQMERGRSCLRILDRTFFSATYVCSRIAAVMTQVVDA
jgi:hypothetical protein